MPNEYAHYTHDDIVTALRQMTGMDHVGRIAHLAADWLEELMQERDGLDAKLKSVQRVARTIHDINGKLISRSGKVYTREQNVDAQIEGVQAANALLTEEVERLTEELSKASEALIRQRLEHDARVTELLEANNAEVERRRKAEAALHVIAAEKDRDILSLHKKHEARVDELIAAHKEKDERRLRAEDTLHNMVENARVNTLCDRIPYSYSIQRGGMISE